MTVQIVDGILYGADMQVARWVAERIPGYRCEPDVRALGIVRDGKLIAATTYENFNGVHLQASIAAEPRSGWATRTVMRHIFGYPFLQLGVQAISLTVGVDNLPSLNLVTKMGFKPEALIRLASPNGADMIVFKMWREECRWIARPREGSPHIEKAA